MTENTRRFPRVPANLEVHFGRDAARISSLSEGGVFIKTRSPLPIGSEVVLTIVLEDREHTSVTLRGRVVWDRTHSESQDGMGVAFLDPVPEALKKVLISSGG
jgi:uncharacterized protein (TIGR02266 family)